VADTSTARQGHNSGQPLTDEEFDDLVLYYSRTIRTQEAKAAIKKAEYDSEKAEVKGLFSKMRGDLKYTRKEFEELLDRQEKTSAELLAEATRMGRLFQAGGVDVRPQLDLFAPAPDTVTEQAQAEKEGRRAYLANQDPVPPKHISPILHPDWMRGWQAEQEQTAMRMARAEAIIARRAEPDADAEPVDLNEGEAGDEAVNEAGDGGGDAGGSQASEDQEPAVPDPAEVEAQAKALEQSGFTAGARKGRGQRKAA